MEKDIIVAGTFKLLPNGLEVIGNPTFEDWIACGKYLYKTKQSLNFIIGDYLRYGELKWGETYRKTAEALGFEIQTLRNCKWVAGQVDASLRKDTLSFSHYALIAEKEPEEQKELIDIAEKEKLTVKEFTSLIKKRDLISEPPKPPEPIKPDESIIESVNSITNATLALSNALNACPFEKLTPVLRGQLLQTLKTLNRRIDGLFMTYEPE